MADKDARCYVAVTCICSAPETSRPHLPVLWWTHSSPDGAASFEPGRGGRVVRRGCRDCGSFLVLRDGVRRDRMVGWHCPWRSSSPSMFESVGFLIFQAVLLFLHFQLLVKWVVL